MEPEETNSTESISPVSPHSSVSELAIFLRRCYNHRRHEFVSVGVAELVDALDSGSSGRKPVGVQIPPSTPAWKLPRKRERSIWKGASCVY